MLAFKVALSLRAEFGGESVSFTSSREKIDEAGANDTTAEQHATTLNPRAKTNLLAAIPWLRHPGDVPHCAAAATKGEYGGA